MAKPVRLTEEARQEADMLELVGYPAFRRFLFRFGLSAGMWAETGGSEDRHLRIAEGRRNLGLEIFRWVEATFPAAHPQGIPVNALNLALSEFQSSGGTYAATADPESDEPDDVVRA